MLRGYRYLRDTNQLALLRDINEQLAHATLIHNTKTVSVHIFGAAAEKADLVLRQYMMRRVAGINLNKVLLIALGDPTYKISYPLPVAWRNILRKNAFSVSGFFSALYWRAYLVYTCTTGVGKWFRTLVQNSKAGFREVENFGKPYVFFSGLQKNNLPAYDADGKSFDVFSWYLQANGRNASAQVLCHAIPDAGDIKTKNVLIKSLPNQFPPLRGFVLQLRALFWFLKALGIAFFHFFTGRWWNTLLFSEAVTASFVRLLPANKLAADYMFHNSEWLYRPLWTYDAERAGARIALYFYSTNIESFLRADGSSKQTGSWNIINWPVYFVWDQYQADFLKREVENIGEIFITGNVWFSSNAEQVPVLHNKSIAVFDIAPCRPSFYVTLAQPLEYYTLTTAISFMEDIREPAAQCGYQLVIKQKRTMGTLIEKRYKSYIDRISGVKEILVVNPEISASRLIDKCDAVISMPFTSTALIGKELGKPSVYYDPTGMIQKNDPGAHGIMVLSKQQELKEWLHKVMEPVS
ncbi:MAG: polysaccharide biosynthesis PFTS motif protein [Sediminibacterium sp.]